MYEYKYIHICMCFEGLSFGRIVLAQALNSDARKSGKGYPHRDKTEPRGRQKEGCLQRF